MELEPVSLASTTFADQQALDHRKRSNSWANFSTHSSLNVAGRHNVPSDAGSERAIVIDPEDPNKPDFPDGGAEAWGVILGGWCVLFVTFGWITSIGVFQEYYQHHQLRDYSASEVAWIPALQVFMMMVTAPFYGKIFDNYGPRYLLFFGTIFHVFGLMMASLSTKYYQFLLSQGLCSPLGSSATFYAAINSGSTWFSKKRALALGIESSGSSLGGVIFPIMIYHLLPKIGFGWTMRAVAFMILGLLIIGNLTVKSNVKPHKTPFRIMDFVGPLQEPPFILTVAANFVFFIVNLVPPNFMILQAEQEGMSPRLSQYLLPIFNSASIFGRILPAHAGDHLGRFNVMIVTTILSGIVVLGLWIPAHENVTLMLFAAFFGFSSGAWISLTPVLIAQISDIRQIGVRIGTNFFIQSFAGLIGNPIAGAILSNNGGRYIGLQIFCGVIMLASALVYIAARNVQCGFKWKRI